MSVHTEAESRFGPPDFRQANDRTIKYAAFVEGWDTALSSIDTEALGRFLIGDFYHGAEDPYQAAERIAAFLRGEGDNDG